jgi:hypothetical protein
MWRDFRLASNGFFATFFEGHDFDEGEDRLCWTMAGLNKLMALGLWKRELDQRGNLKAKPPTVAQMMGLAMEQRSETPTAYSSPDQSWSAGASRRVA